MADLTAEQEAAQAAFAGVCKPAPVPAVEREGIELAVPADEYHRRELHVASKSALDQIDRSPAHYLAWLHGEERAQTPALRFGSAFHMLVLEPERFARTYAVRPDFGDMRTKAAKERRETWLAAHPGVTELPADDDEAMRGMLAAVYKHDAASRLILEGSSEVTLRWRDAMTGLRCKARADYWVKGKRLAVDLKTTDDASPDEFARSVYKYGYAQQDALYRAGFLACGEPIDHFAIVAVEKAPPHAVAVYVLDADAVGKGYTATRRGIERLADCIKHDDWPAYGDGINELSLPRWAA